MHEAHQNAMRRDKDEYGVDHEDVWKEIWIPNDVDFEKTFHPKAKADLVVAWFGQNAET